MAPTWRSTGAGGATAGNNLFTPPAPAGLAVGDLDVLCVYADAGAIDFQSADNKGYVAVEGSPFSGPGTEKLYIWQRIYGGEGSATLVSSGMGATDSVLGVRLAYQGTTFDTETPIADVGTPNNGTGTAVSNTGVTAPHPDCVALHVFGLGDNGSASGWAFGGSTTGVTERADIASSAGADAQLSVAEKTVASQGATGSATATGTLSAPWVSVTLAIAPVLVTQTLIVPLLTVNPDLFAPTVEAGLPPQVLETPLHDEPPVLFAPTVVQSPPEWSLWESVSPPSAGGSLLEDSAAVSLGTRFTVDAETSITHVRFYFPAGGDVRGATPDEVAIYNTSGTQLGYASNPLAPSSGASVGWNDIELDTPVTAQPGTTYVAVAHFVGGSDFRPRYFGDAGYWSERGSDIDVGQLHADWESPGSGYYEYGADIVHPTNTFGSASYFVDVIATLPTEGATQTLVVPLLTVDPTLFPPEVEPPPQTLTLPLLTVAPDFYAPSLGLGSVTLETPLLAVEPELFAPTVSAGAVDLIVPLLEISPELFAPTVETPETATLVVPLLDVVPQLFAPTVEVGTTELVVPLLDVSPQLFAPAVQLGGITIVVPLLEIPPQLFGPTVVPGSVELTLPLLEVEPQLLEPTVRQRIVLQLLEVDPELLAPELVLGPVELSVPLLDIAPSFFPPTLLRRVWKSHPGVRKVTKVAGTRQSNNPGHKELQIPGHVEEV
jgi:hypothetical protein